MRTKLDSVKIIFSCLFLMLFTLNLPAQTSTLNSFKIIPQAQLSILGLTTTNQLASQNETNNLQKPILGSKPKLILDNKLQLQNLYKSQSQGPKTGGGGNSCALSVTQNTLKMKLILEQQKILTEDQYKLLILKINQSKFYIKNNLSINGQIKDAINYPESLEIHLTENFCAQKLSEVSGQAMSLLLHEYLGLSKINDSKYQISGEFFERYKNDISIQMIDENYIQSEVAKDLNGESSCFNGHVLKMSKSLTETMGDRFDETQTPSIQLLQTQSIRERSQEENNCNIYHDQNSKKTENAERYRFQICNSTDEYNYIGKVEFNYSTTGTHESESLVYRLTKKVTTQLKIDLKKPYNPESRSDIASKKITTQYRCFVK